VEQRRELVAFHEGSGAPQTTSARVQRFHHNRWRLLRKLGKLRYPLLARALLSLRFTIELLVLLIGGHLLARSVTSRRDKIEGRKALLRWVLSGLDEHARPAANAPTSTAGRLP
jgi:hypothetical protein